MADTWIIKTANGDVTNPKILANEDFIVANFSHYEKYVPSAPSEPTAEQEARMWRDDELMASDQASQTPDWPNRANILLYRTALRNWPSTSDFPATKPTLG